MALVQEMALVREIEGLLVAGPGAARQLGLAADTGGASAPGAGMSQRFFVQRTTVGGWKGVRNRPGSPVARADPVPAGMEHAIWNDRTPTWRNPCPCFRVGWRRNKMLETIAIILVILWLAGLVSSYTMGGLVHILLVLAVVVILIRVIQGRRPLG